MPADCVTLPDCTQVTHSSLPAVPEVTDKVSREQKRCFVIQNLDSYQLINLGQTVTTKHGTVQSSYTQRCLQEEKGKTMHQTKMTEFSMWQSRHAFFSYFYFSIFLSSFSTFLGGNRRPCHHFKVFIAVS